MPNNISDKVIKRILRQNNIIVTVPIDIAFEMRGKYAYPNDMKSKREKYTMDRIGKAIDEGTIDIIKVDYNDYKKGILTDGKHRLIKYKDKGYKTVNIEVENVPCINGEENNETI